MDDVYTLVFNQSKYQLILYKNKNIIRRYKCCAFDSEQMLFNVNDLDELLISKQFNYINILILIIFSILIFLNIVVIYNYISCGAWIKF